MIVRVLFHFLRRGDIFYTGEKAAIERSSFLRCVKCDIYSFRFLESSDSLIYIPEYINKCGTSLKIDDRIFYIDKYFVNSLDYSDWESIKDRFIKKSLFKNTYYKSNS